MKRKIPVVAILFGVVLAGASGGVLRSVLAGPQTVPQEKDRIRAERVATPKSGTDERTVLPDGNFVAGNGIVEPADRETRIASHIPGRIKALRVVEGQTIEAGAPIADLENEAEVAALRAAEAELSVRKAELLRVARGLRKEDREAIQADTDGARARAELSKVTAQRAELLARAGATSPEDLDRAHRQAESDASTLAAAESRRQAAMAGARSEDVLVAQAQVTAAEARGDQARSTLNRLTIRSPIGGVVLQVKLRAGEYYNPQGGDPVAIVGDTSKLRIRMDLDERDIAKVSVGSKAFATLSAFPGRRFEGKVVEIGRRMGRKNVRTDDPTERIDTKVLEVVVELAEPAGLVPGLRVVSYIEAASDK